MLKEAGVPGNLRIYTAPGHEITVWGLQEGADPNDPSTWGEEAFVVDPWLGKLLTAEEANANEYIGKNGENNIQDQTTAFDKEAKAWEVTGRGRSSARGGECFIATAAYETPLARDIQVLRDFRDQVLLRSASGRTLVQLYYRNSPPLAAALAQNNLARTVVREVFLKPTVRLLVLTDGLWQTPGE